MANDINGSVEEEVLDGVLTTDQNFKGDPGIDGTTFTPWIDTVDGKKFLKWSNDGGKPNPVDFNLSELATGLPPVTAADNGKILMVVDGEWVVVSPSEIPNLVTYQDT